MRGKRWRKLSKQIVAIQMTAKIFGMEIYKDWSKDPDKYKEFASFIAEWVRIHAPQYASIIDRFYEKLKNARTIKEAIMACKDVWDETNGLLDLCP